MPVYFMPVATVESRFPVLVEAIKIPARTAIIVNETIPEAVRPPVDRLGFTPVEQGLAEGRG